MIGNVVGNYKVIDKIGEGGMGAVYKGVDLMLEREVAIKVLKPELASQPQVVERFRSEAVTLAKLNHPNIATLYNFFRQGDDFFMVLEFVNGTPLEKIIEAHGVMTCEQAIPLFCQMLEGIDHAHSFGIIHRDIKPANMMMTQSGLLKVLDFGIARALGSARMTRAGHLIGTIEYMSPEQVRGMDTDARSDIYALGMVLYEMLTGRVPFASDSEFELMRAQVEQLPTPPREFAPNIPEEVEWAILCATEKDPDKRFQTAGAFGGAIVDSVNTAIAAGALSQIEMRSPTSRLTATVLGTDQMSSRISSNSAPGFAQSNPTVLIETEATDAETRMLPPPTLFAPDIDKNQTVTASDKTTRVGIAAEFEITNFSNPDTQASAGQQPSLLGRLNKKHYIIGASAAALLCIGLVVIVAALFLRGGTSKAEEVEPAPPPAASPVAPPIETTEQPVEPDRSVVGPEAENVSDKPTGQETQPQSEPNRTIPSPGTKSQKAAQSSGANEAARQRAKRAREALNK